MRDLIQLLEDVAASQTVTLFRGDSTTIDQFDISKTDMYALFGRGIYLTDNKRIAGDYKSKGSGGDVLFRMRGAKSKKEVIQRYAERLARTIDADGNDHSSDARYWGGNAVPYSDGGDYSVITNDLRQNERAQRLQHALTHIKALMKTYEVRVKLDGEAVIQKKQGAANIAAFAVPAQMVASTIHADAEIDSDVLSVITYHLKHAGDRTTAEDIEQFVREEERENGQTPSFRTVFTGITRESPVHDNQEEIISDLIEMGYTGIHYLGGLSMGGGIKHNAYVFWDANAINACRIK